MSILNDPLNPEEELEFFRNCRLLGIIPNPLRLTGERRKWAEEMTALRKRFNEIDALVRGDKQDASDKD